jgi:hypothetical protein
MSTPSTVLRCFAVLVLCGWSLPMPVPGADLSESEQKRKAMNDASDKLKLRQKTDFVEDRSEAFLKLPATKPPGDYDVGKTIPTVKLQILPNLEPEYFSGDAQYMACWANWGYVTRSDDNRFFFGASDHLGRGATINIYEYSARSGKLQRILEMGKLLGWTPETYTDGKLHGCMGIMPDGMMWGTTHEAVHPDEKWYAAGYRGSWLFSYNINTREAKSWGVPLVGDSLPCSTLDEKRGRFMIASSGGEMVAWDCNEKRVRYAGWPPNGWKWWARSLFCDRSTGIYWGMDSSQEPPRFMSFDPELNRFARYEVTVPSNPILNKPAALRGHTPDPAMDGWVYWATLNGALFRFKPSGTNAPVVEVSGVTWDQGRDTLQMAMEPKGRYVYYFPKGDPSPIVQFDVKTGRKKALCWLQDFYFEKYGYILGEVYGMEVAKDGSFLVICVNGEFSDKRAYAYGHPALVVVEIPKEERPE